jgi:hypothetical protein
LRNYSVGRGYLRRKKVPLTAGLQLCGAKPAAPGHIAGHSAGSRSLGRKVLCATERSQRFGIASRPKAATRSRRPCPELAVLARAPKGRPPFDRARRSWRCWRPWRCSKGRGPTPPKFASNHRRKMAVFHISGQYVRSRSRKAASAGIWRSVGSGGLPSRRSPALRPGAEVKNKAATRPGPKRRYQTTMF